jgi:hypothetical protein
MSKGFIRYEVKNDVEDASVYKSQRVDGKPINDIRYLGKVIDKAKGIYQSREKGMFHFTLERGVIEYIAPQREKLILDFGDSYFLSEMLKRCGFMEMLSRVFGEKTSVVSALVFYKALQGGANCYAQNWWEGSYARLLFPAISLASQRITDILREIGDEYLQRTFFKEYLRYVSSQCGDGILIDSTGLPNDICFPLTAINNHNGVISNETRLVLVLDKKSGLPIYFRYVAGNIVDVATLEATIAEVRAYGVDVRHAIVDAGYYSEKNIKAMHESEISFVLRMPANRKLYKELIEKYAADLEDAKYLVKYRDRFAYIKRLEIDLFGKNGYAYIAMDIDRKHDEIKKYIAGAIDDKNTSHDDMNNEIRAKGLFILVSSEKHETTDVLPLYYTRQAIEQVFDISKNNADLLPLRVHGIDSFRGLLLISFMVSATYVIVSNMMKKSNVCALGAYQILRNLKCKVYEGYFIVQEPNKKMNDVAKFVKLKFPLMSDFFV